MTMRARAEQEAGEAADKESADDAQAARTLNRWVAYETCPLTATDLPAVVTTWGSERQGVPRRTPASAPAVGDAMEPLRPRARSAVLVRTTTVLSRWDRTPLRAGADSSLSTVR
jgi:hypothetical protein